MRRPPPARFPLIRWPSSRTVLTAALACLAAIVVFRITSQAAATSDALGERVEVWVADEAVPAGSSLSRDEVSAQEWPVAFVPDGPVTDDPVGRTTRTDIAAGEVLIRNRIAGEDGTGPAALIPDGWRAVAVPTFDAAPPVQPGQLVDVVVSIEGAEGPGTPGVLVENAVVIDVSDTNVVSVAVPARAAPTVASATILGVVTLTMVG